MAGRLYLHIGPPKTATTAFQYALQNGIPGQLVYGGARQPRSSGKSELSGRLNRVCNRYRKSVSADIQEVRTDIAAILSEGTDLLISEEGLLVDGLTAPFQAKIANLGLIVGSFGPVVIFCARDPLEGLPSLYQELYRNLPLGQKLSFERFLRGNQAAVFDYPALVEVLRRAGFQNIRVIDFERLVSGSITFPEIFGPEIGTEQKLVIAQTNSGSFCADKHLRRLPPLQLRDLVPGRRLFAKIIHRKIRQNAIIEKIGTTFGGLALTKERAKRLELSESAANRLRMGYAKIVADQGSLLRG